MPVPMIPPPIRLSFLCPVGRTKRNTALFRKAADMEIAGTVLRLVRPTFFLSQFHAAEFLLAGPDQHIVFDCDFLVGVVNHRFFFSDFSAATFDQPSGFAVGRIVAQVSPAADRLAAVPSSRSPDASWTSGMSFGRPPPRISFRHRLAASSPCPASWY